MTIELGGVLEHIETISRLDLEGVPPTTPRDRRRRARCALTSRSRACLASWRWRARRRCSTTASQSRARRHERTWSNSTAAQAAAAIGRGDLDRARAVRGLPRAGRRGRVERVHLGCARRSRRRARGRSAASPLAVKDLFCTEGVPSQSGSRILEGYRPPYTATVVERLARAGAPLLGKTNQDEFAMGSSTENSGFGPTLNPWDRTRVPGGSSGGSAAAVAAGLAPWAIGTDTGGSIRQPAALCGIVGLKPTYGAVSRYGMIAFASSLDQAGPLTRDVSDAALLLSQMVGARDPRDATSLDFPGPIEPSGADGPARDSSRRSGRAARAMGSSRACSAPSRRASSSRASSGAERRDVRSCRTRRTRSPPTTCSRRPRHRRTSRASTASATATARRTRPTCSICTRGPATTASAPRSSAGSCSAPTRSRAATTTPTTVAPSACAR